MSLIVLATGYGGPEVLTVVDAPPLPPPGPGQVRVRVRAAGVNPADLKRYGGDFGTEADLLPLRLGFEAAAEVTAVGPDALGPLGPIAVGDEVVAFRVSGAYAEELTVPAGAVLPRPPQLDPEQAAGLLLAGATAVHALAATGVGPTDTVLVHGGAGGVGLMAVQLAALRGARVVATASPSRHDLLRELGADPVAYGPGLAARVRAAAPGGVTAAIDTVGSDEAVDSSVELVADRDRIASIAAFKRGPQAGIRLLGGGPGADPGTQLRDAARPELVRLAADGSLRVLVAATYPLTEVAAAHRAMAGRRPPGKVILVP